MFNLLTPVLTFIFVFSLIWVLRAAFIFFSALFSNPPKPFEISKVEVLAQGLLISYIITFLIHL